MKIISLLIVFLLGSPAFALTVEDAEIKAHSVMALATENPLKGTVTRVCELKVLIPPQQSERFLFWPVGRFDIQFSTKEALLIEYVDSGYTSTIAFLNVSTPKYVGNFARFFVYQGVPMNKVKNNTSDLLARLQVSELSFGECFDISEQE